MIKDLCSQELLEAIGGNLHSIRNARKETLQAVASALGVSHPVISKIENGRYQTFNIAMLVKLCNYYQVSLSQIFMLDQQTIFQLTSRNTNNGSSEQQPEVAADYAQSIEQYKSEISHLRSLIEAFLKNTNFKDSG